MNKSLNEILEKAKEISIKWGHRYVSTEHFVSALLHYKKYQILFGTDNKKFTDAVLSKIGKGTHDGDVTITAPLLLRITSLASDIDEVIYDLFINEQDGIAVRILEIMKTRSEYVDMLNRIRKLQEDVDIDMPKYLTNLNDKEYITDPAIGRDIDIDTIEKILLKMNKPNVLLVGEPGVGKTAIVEGLAYRIKNGNVCDNLKNKIIVSVAVSSLVAGTKYRGEFEEKVEALCDFLKEHNNVILFIDEMHTTIEAGGADGAIDMSQILKPYLARGDIRVIGATTLKESKVISEDGAYNRRFTTLLIEEPTSKDTKNIINKSINKFEKFYDIKINKKLIDYIVEKSRNLDGKLPDKAIELLENVCSDIVWNNEKSFNKKDIDRVLEEIIDRKEQLNKIELINKECEVG